MRDVFLLGSRPDDCTLPVPLAKSSTQAGQEPVGLTIVVDDARRIGPAIIIDLQFEAPGRHIRTDDAVGEACRRAYGAYRIPVCVGRNTEFGHCAQARGCMAYRRRIGHVGMKFRKALHAIVEFMIQKYEEIGTFQVGVEVPVAVVVVAINRTAVGCKADIRIQCRQLGIVFRAKLTVWIADRIGIEFAAAIPEVQRIGQSRYARPDVVLAIFGVGAGTTESGATRVRAILRNQTTEIVVGPPRIILRIDRITIVVTAENAQVRAPVVEERAPLCCDLVVAARQTFPVRIARLHTQAVKIVFQNVVDHAGNGVRAIDSRCTVAQDLDALETEHG